MALFLEKLRKFFSYWYLRYLLVTELYMVEPWEKVVIHIVLAMIFVLFWYFNKSIILTGISQLRNTTADIQLVS